MSAQPIASGSRLAAFLRHAGLVAIAGPGVLLFAEPRLIDASKSWADVVMAAQSSGLAADASRTASVSESKKKASSRAGANAVASAAREFYTQFPGHPNAVKARKIEVLALLDDSSKGGVTSEKDADRAADQFRKDSALPAADRFDVAWRAERRKLKQNGNGRADRSDIERLADRLKNEFGDVESLYDVYGELMRNSAFEDANRIAQKILASPAPEYLKTAAKAETTRYALRGKKVGASIADGDGKPLTLATGKNAYTVLYFSRASDRLNVFAATTGLNLTWVRVATEPEASSGDDTANPRVATCVERDGLKGPLCSALGVTAIPYIVILDGNQKVRSYGAPQFLASMLEDLAP